MTHRSDPIRCNHSGRVWPKERWQWRGAPHSPKFQDYSNLTIRLFSIISMTLVAGEVTPLQRCSRCILQPQLTGPLVRGVLPLCRGAVNVFYRPSQPTGQLKHMMTTWSKTVAKAAYNFLKRRARFLSYMSRVIKLLFACTCQQSRLCS